MSSGGGLNLRLGAHLQIASTGVIQNKAIQVDQGCTITNNGQILSAFSGATIILVEGTADARPTIINNSSIQLTDDGNAATYNLQVRGYSILDSGHDGYIYGTGSMQVTGQHPRFEIANPGGFMADDGAIRITGTNSFSKADYLFNGTVPQHVGNIPEPIWSLTIDNPTIVTLDNNIEIDGNYAIGFARVTSGSTLDMGPYIIKSSKTWGDARFYLEDGATLITQHSEGVSSETVADLIIKGCIQTNFAGYSSAANYTYNASGNQDSGVFTTTPTANTVNDLTVGINTNLTWQNGGTLPTVNGTYTKEEETLPVTLSSFTATILGFNNVQILWNTASETNCLGYRIWRANDADLANATCISSMLQAANSSQGAHYVFTDIELYEEGTYYYWLEDIAINNESQFHGHIQVTLTSQGETPTPEVVQITGFQSNYPNPFNPSTNLRFGLSKDSDVTVRFYNLRGQLVDSMHLANQKKGINSLVWDTNDLGISSGVYFAQMSSNSGNDILKITLSE